MNGKSKLILAGVKQSIVQIVYGLTLGLAIVTVVSPILFLWIQVEKWLWNLIAKLF